MTAPLPFERGDAFELTEFLASAGLETAGVGDPGLELWLDVDPDGRIVGSTGFELAGGDALLRAVAVSPSRRRRGRGTELARFALDEARSRGADRAWLLSRQATSFCAALGFETSAVAELPESLAGSHQVTALVESGLLRYESAWSMRL